MADVETFCNTHGFADEVDLFKKGALVAQNPASFEDLPMLTEDDRYWLRREITNRWDQPKMLYFTIGVLSLGSAVQGWCCRNRGGALVLIYFEITGWDNTGVNGANLVSEYLLQAIRMRQIHLCKRYRATRKSSGSPIING